MSLPDAMMKRPGNTSGGGGVRISTGLKDGWRTIRVSDAGPGQRAALEELGFPPDLVQRYPPGTRYFDRAVANLRQALGEIATQKSARTPANWPVPFRDLLSRAGQARVPLAVVGSVALAVRGVDVCPGDIDVLTTLEGADALAESYQDALVVPLFTSPGFGRFGRAFTGGIRVEWLGNPARAQEGPWPLAAAAWSIASPFEEVSWENRLLRVPPLELQRAVEAQRQRQDRVAAIDDFRRTRAGVPRPARDD
jgi:hypothetical protein